MPSLTKGAIQVRQKSSRSNDDYIWVEQTLGPDRAMRCARHIATRPYASRFYYDFSKMQHCPPFGVLLLANSIRANMRKYPDSEHIPIRIDESQGGNYARSLGLFKMLGWEDGKKELNDSGQTFHIPIVELTPDSLRGTFGEGVVLGNVIERAAEKMALTLTQSGNLEITKALQYCIREMVRNTFEHGETKSLWICGQYWPQKGRAEIAIMDEGCGIKQSLQRNPRFKCATDKDAHKLALQPGVSRMVGIRQDPYDDWQNSGYGLYVSSSLCTLGGHFIIAGGTDATFINEKGQKNYDTQVTGTIVCLALNANNIGNHSELLRTIVREGEKLSKEYGGDRILTASKVSSIASITAHIKEEQDE